MSSLRMFVRQRTNPRGVRAAIDDQLRRFALQGNGADAPQAGQDYQGSGYPCSSGTLMA